MVSSRHARHSQEIRRALAPIIPQFQTSQAHNKTRMRTKVSRSRGRSRPATRNRLHQGNQEITMGSQPRTRREKEHRHTSDVRRLYHTQQMLPKRSLPVTTNRPNRRLNRRMRSTVISRCILGLSPDTDEGGG